MYSDNLVCSILLIPIEIFMYIHIYREFQKNASIGIKKISCKFFHLICFKETYFCSKKNWGQPSRFTYNYFREAFQTKKRGILGNGPKWR